CARNRFMGIRVLAYW
nr:immunoglobulin heavy chain junction region [Macaca mulatta]MOX61282.1 immunoglobulin heavy chain junction region [Macaca mulatta]MOX61806.1 immunoglobulin heavy chain junction region [Macaca mulatta]MOX64385.1 immunoglobulin heavy chain junction region [Macaca mulatta]MOX64531.1 immunoglobulin heavy chain junction region [Macaca mulatta]